MEAVSIDQDIPHGSLLIDTPQKVKVQLLGSSVRYLSVIFAFLNTQYKWARTYQSLLKERELIPSRILRYDTTVCKVQETWSDVTIRQAVWNSKISEHSFLFVEYHPPNKRLAYATRILPPHGQDSESIGSPCMYTQHCCLRSFSIGNW